jgi:hypothetical protein
MPKIRTIVLSLAALSQAACTSGPGSVEARYVSPNTYQSWSCAQLFDEKARLASEVDRVSSLQRENANADTAIVAAGIILAPILLIGLAATKDRKEELGRLKGEYEAVDNNITARQCNAGLSAGGATAPQVATAPAVSYAGTYAGKGTTDSYCITPSLSITIDAGNNVAGTLSEQANGAATGTITGNVTPTGQLVLAVKSGSGANVNGTYRGTVTATALNVDMKQPSPGDCHYKFSLGKK